jgi:hypothetical protein
MKKLTLGIAFLLLLLGISEVIRWFRITERDISFEAMKVEYMTALPNFLQNTMLHTFLLILCFTGSALLFLQSRNERGLKFIAKGGAVLGFVLAFWQLFSLM